MKLAILVVEDHKDLAEATAWALRARGHDVRVETDPRLALDYLLSDADIDLTLLDLLLPGFNGSEIYEACRAQAPARIERIVFLTGFALMVPAWLRNTGRLVLEKPVSPDRLARVAIEYGNLQVPRGPRFDMTKKKKPDIVELLSNAAGVDDGELDEDDTGVFVASLQKRGSDPPDSGNEDTMIVAAFKYLHGKHSKLAKRFTVVEKKIDRLFWMVSGIVVAAEVAHWVYEFLKR